MPTITFSLKDLEKLVGKKLTIEEVTDLAHYGKGDFENYDKRTDEIKIDFGDTNLPYLWSVEGIARLVKGITGKQKGIPKIKVNKGNYKIIVDKSVSKVRPYIAGFVAKGHKIDDYLLKQLIQLQEKLSDNFGRRRQKISIGLYSYEKINFPVYYKAVNPDAVEFIPLGFNEKMNLNDILKKHPKGEEYGYVIKSFDKHPLLIDSKNEVLSFPPIINSNLTGKIEVGDDKLLVEITGTDMRHVLLAADIFSYALCDRGFSIYSLDVRYGNKAITTPTLENKKYTIEKIQIKKLFGIELKDAEIKNILEKSQYNILSMDKEKIRLEIPSYRDDIMHQNDVVEDIGIFHGFESMEELTLKSFTTGSSSKFVEFIDKVRGIVIGLGYQEILSPMLNNKNAIYGKMNIQDMGTVEIEEYISETYSVIRSWILPNLNEVFSKNKHISYPQKIFEEGIVNVRKANKIFDFSRVAIAVSHEKADFTEMKQVLDVLSRLIGFEYSIEEAEHGSFIDGRVGRVIVNNKKIGYIGEINPAVLENWGLEMPVAAMELNLSELFEVI